MTFGLVLETILNGNRIQMISLMVIDLTTLKGTPDLRFNSQVPNISMHILHTVLKTFPKTQTRRICVTIKGFFS